MRRRGFLKAGSVLALSSLTPPLRAAEKTPPIAPAKTDLIPAFERLVPRLMRETVVPGVSIALVQSGQLFWSRGFGLRSAETKEPVEEQTLFEAASVSKTVFAYAILKLCEKSTFSLDVPLTKYVPWRFLENDSRLDQITARHILSHTGGFQDWRSGDHPLQIHFTPGEKFMYSGEGYFYLQSVLTHLTGRVDRNQCAQYEAGLEVCATDFGAYMRRNLLEPFGMSSSTYQPADHSQSARGHNTDGKPNPAGKPRGSDVARYGSAGGLLTTARDYAKFLIEIIAPKPADDFRLGTTRHTEMIKPHIKLPPDQLIDGATSWALGWAVQERKEGNILVHSGGQSGFRSLAMAFPEKRSGFIVLTNSDNGGKLIYHQELLDLLDRLLVSAD